MTVLQKYWVADFGLTRWKRAQRYKTYARCHSRKLLKLLSEGVWCGTGPPPPPPNTATGLGPWPWM